MEQPAERSTGTERVLPHYGLSCPDGRLRPVPEQPAERTVDRSERVLPHYGREAMPGQSAAPSPSAAALGSTWSQGTNIQRPAPPQTEATLGRRPPKADPGVARCHYCTVTEGLRRVRCCGVHFCSTCLTELIKNACERPGIALTCLSCKSVWDLEQLARACNVDVTSVRAGRVRTKDMAAALATAPTLGTGSTAGQPHQAVAVPPSPAVPSATAGLAKPLPTAPAQVSRATMPAAATDQNLGRRDRTASRCSMCHRAGVKLLPARCCSSPVCFHCDALGGAPNCICAQPAGAVSQQASGGSGGASMMQHQDNVMGYQAAGIQCADSQLRRPSKPLIPGYGAMR
eukprot:gnl/TRDRNA2_/TRDRNA2_63074_c0_seq1.p1 gnl/TRDRNA2_/TRDRNA2_63074_c0~~gnl/TRDRNA2_/TRDRNA2_63074_c0_seq1.p1  ORF type:complete len:375 (-),score=35.00 gnl/TRDRNA2_/TRDRNA2_63074_c0_seq1:63-1094(-)